MTQTENKVHLSWYDVDRLAKQGLQPLKRRGRRLKIWGIPRGGVYAALVYKAAAPDDVDIVGTPEEADLLVDDIIDSGVTAKEYSEKYKKDVLALVVKEPGNTDWIVFCWEHAQNELGPEENIKRILQYIGEDVEREGLRETPSRVVKSYSYIFGGYKEDVSKVMKVFKEESSDEMIVLKDIEFYSTCEHHMQPFFGKAHIAYIPDGKVLGVSKLARVLEIYARRLQIQERLTDQITEAIMKHLEPLGAACMIEAKHFCMICRGVEKQNSIMMTSSLKGAFKDKPEVRSEFLTLIGKS